MDIAEGALDAASNGALRPTLEPSHGLAKQRTWRMHPAGAAAKLGPNEQGSGMIA